MSKLYEMHVYTAGSRSYANAVCKGIDPNGKYFSERILSRDESGSGYGVVGTICRANPDQSRCGCQELEATFPDRPKYGRNH